ncbi:MAG TPA: D-lyxose/D-mannose family sugar isomerase [Armatimonadota bacterium]|jgi:D-lyxose ketol-isomerase
MPDIELEKALTLALQGDARTQALTACREQLARWGMVMPTVEPLVSDFGIDDFAQTGLIEYWIANEMAAGYCGKYLFVFDGQSCPLHAHKVKHETFFLVHGRVRMSYHGEVREMAPGDVLPVWPGVEHGFTGLGPALLLEVSMPCVIADNYFADPRIQVSVVGETP